MKQRRAIWRKLLLGVLLALAADASSTAQAADEKAAPPESKLYWVFLTTGKSTQGVDRAEIEAMQAAHLANFRRLHADGKLFTAGPMADPEKKKRGIVAVTAQDMKSLPELFTPDPYVSQGYMTLDAIEMEVGVGEFRTDIDPQALAEYRLVLLEDATEDQAGIDAELKSKNLEYCQSIHDDERLCFAAWLQEDAGRRRAVLIFRKLDDDALNSLVAELPAVKSKAWKATTFPLFMSAGIVK